MKRYPFYRAEPSTTLITGWQVMRRDRAEDIHETFVAQCDEREAHVIVEALNAAAPLAPQGERAQRIADSVKGK